MRWEFEKFQPWLNSWLGAGGVLFLSVLWAQGQSSTGTATLEFSQPRYTAKPDGPAATIIVLRTGNTNIAAEAEFATADETALAGTDYVAKKGPINFAPGQA